MNLRIVLGITFIAAAAFLAGCSSETQKSDGDRTDLAAKIGNDWELTIAELDTRIQGVPENRRAQYETIDGMAEFADGLIQEELYYMEGLAEGLDKDPAVKEKIKAYERQILIDEYYNRFVKALAMPSEEDMHDYYEAHKDRYSRKPVARIQHILAKDRKTVAEFKRQIEAKEERMTTLAHKYSEDVLTRGDGGDLGWFEPGGYIRSIGFSKEISDAAFSLEVGEVSDPIKWQKGWSIIRLNDFRPGELMPYEDVKDRIAQAMMRKDMDQVREAVYAELQKKYDVTNYVANRASLVTLTAEELWARAQMSDDAHFRIRNYEQLVEKYPTHAHAPDALFMIGFVYAEELKDLVQADRTLLRVINEYPDAEVAKTARWMRKNMNEPLPKFEDLDELNDQIEEKKEQESP